MKKLNLLFAMALPLAIMGNIDNANAERANHTKKDVPVVENTKKNPAEMKDMKKDMPEHHGKMDKKMKHDEKLKHQEKEINEDYEKATKKINKSTFNDEQKKMLMNQAKENKNLAMKQNKERMDMMKKHWDQRMNDEGFKAAMKAEKANKKAVKEVKEIID